MLVRGEEGVRVGNLYLPDIADHQGAALNEWVFRLTRPSWSEFTAIEHPSKASGGFLVRCSAGSPPRPPTVPAPTAYEECLLLPHTLPTYRDSESATQASRQLSRLPPIVSPMYLSLIHI